jgi:hypothetical protein
MRFRAQNLPVMTPRVINLDGERLRQRKGREEGFKDQKWKENKSLEGQNR